MVPVSLAYYHRMLNAVEPGTDIPIHRYPIKDESFVIPRGKSKEGRDILW